MMMMMTIIIIIIMGVRTRCSGKGLCKNLDILPVPCVCIQYIQVSQEERSIFWEVIVSVMLS